VSAFAQAMNTDRHLWPDTSPVDAPEESIHVTQGGGIGINVGGHVIVKPLREIMRDKVCRSLGYFQTAEAAAEAYQNAARELHDDFARF
jgi:hypothetical protein